MLECPVTGRLGAGAAVMMWLGCRYQPMARTGDGGVVGVVVEAILTARKIFARKEPDKAMLAYTRGGGRSVLSWVIERGWMVSSLIDDIEPCKVELRTVSGLIDRLNHQEKSEVEKATFLCHRLTRLLRSYPLLRALVGVSAEPDATKMILQLRNTVMTTAKLSMLSSEE